MIAADAESITEREQKLGRGNRLAPGLQIRNESLRDSDLIGKLFLCQSGRDSQPLYLGAQSAHGRYEDQLLALHQGPLRAFALLRLEDRGNGGQVLRD